MTLRVLALLAVLHALVGWAFLRASGPGLPLDDAWGHLVYARAIAQGDGFAYNPDRPENGVSSPLWTLLAAVPAALSEWTGGRLRPDLGLRALGGVFGLLTALVGFRLGLRAGMWPAVFVAAALSLDPLLIFTRFCGMELPLFALLTLLFVEALLDDNLRAAGMVAGLAVLTRPEGLLLAGVAAFRLLRQRRSPAPVLLPVLLFALPFAGWCQWVSGHPWPNTWSNKAEFVTDGSSLLASLSALGADTGYAWALLPLLVAGVFALEGIASRLALLPLLLSGVLLLGVLLSRALPVAFDPPRVPFYWERYALLAWPPLVLVAAVGMGSVVRTAWAGLRCRPRAAAVLLAPLVVVLVLLRGLPAHAAAIHQRYAAECADVEALNVAAGRWIDAHLPPDALVATHDAGAVRYFGRRRVLDLWGNNDSELNALLADRDRALASGDAAGAARGQRAVEDYLLGAAPDALAAFPMTYAAEHSPELVAYLPTLPEAERQQLLAVASDYAGFLGLTHRAATFVAPFGAVIGSPLHESFAIFVRPPP